VSAKDVILEVLRRMTVKGGVGKIIEYGGGGEGGARSMSLEMPCSIRPGTKVVGRCRGRPVRYSFAGRV